LQCEILNFDYIDHEVYLKRRTEEKIIRLGSVPFNQGDVWYLRLALRNAYPTSLKDLRTVNGTIYNTFQQACEALGIVADGSESRIAFEEAISEFATPVELRSFFVCLTLQGYPTLSLFDDYNDNMGADFLPETTRLEQLRNDLQLRFQKENKQMENYGLRPPRNAISLLEREYSNIADSMSFTVRELARLHQQEPNTYEMIPVYDEITMAISNIANDDDPIFFAIDSQGGSGKSTFAKKIYYFTRSLNQIALGSAATGLATQVIYQL
jgi:hypothetical protein